MVCRAQIQEALNQQTYHQFRAYAEQQFPGDPHQVQSLHLYPFATNINTRSISQ